MPPTSKEEYESLLDRIETIFSDILEHADKQSRTRCPYRNRADECTARFSCRSRRPGPSAAANPVCGHGSALDYRDSWEADQEGAT